MTTALKGEDQLETLRSEVSFLVGEARERQAFRQSVTELTGDLGPITRQGMESMGRVLADLEQRGYADFVRSGLGVVDRIVTSFTEEDIEALGDNVVLILETVKEMTQPDVMRMLQTTFHNVAEIEPDVAPPSLFRLVRQMKDPEVRRGLARLIAVVRTMGESEPVVKDPRKETQN